ncbi:MAG: hypothetical protein V4441_06250 [Pseudomonadota bacterium]
MSANYRKALERQSFSNQIRSCAAAFVELQALRHEADYDPAKRISLTDAKAAATNARQAMADLISATEDERQLFLTILLRFKTQN